MVSFYLYFICLRIGFPLPHRYFTESVKVLEHLGMFLVDVECKVREIKARQDDQRRTLVQVKEDLSRMVVDKEVRSKGTEPA